MAQKIEEFPKPGDYEIHGPDGEFPPEFVQEILTLLDLIEVDEDHTLARHRFRIAEKHGMTVVIGEPISGMRH